MRVTWSMLATAGVAYGLISPPENLSTVLSQKFPGAIITYKRTTICETTPGVKAYSGFVKLPKALLEDSQGWADDNAANLYFWYFESRNNPETAATTIRLGGGPGTTSLGATTNFPCLFNTDGNSTTVNPESWNTNANMLYIDQPIGTGFSYVSLVSGTKDLVTSLFTASPNPVEDSQLNQTVVRATLDQMQQGNRSLINTALVPRTTAGSARTLWTFMQVWANEFPEIRTSNRNISVWGSSYGGFYAPALMDLMLERNALISSRSADLPPMYANATVFNLDTLGLAEACVDARLTAQTYPEFARNNTYGIELYSEEVYKNITALIDAPEKGCNALVDACRALSTQGDPKQFGLNDTVNTACAAATEVCFFKVQGAGIGPTSRSPFDITMDVLTLVPAFHEMAFFNQEWVQSDLGVPLNFTAPTNANPILASFFGVVGDPMVRDVLALQRVHDAGLDVVMATGDRDYRCPWTGAETIALTVSPGLAEAGYTPLRAGKGKNCTAPTGLVRERGRMSMTRIFQGGHGLAPYASKSMFSIFERARLRKDVATGKVDLREQEGYASQGPKDVRNVTNVVPEPPQTTCYLYSVLTSCTKEQIAALAAGTAEVKDFVIVKPEGLKGISKP